MTWEGGNGGCEVADWCWSGAGPPLCRFATSPPAERGERGTGAASSPVARAEGELSHGDGLLVDMSLVEWAEWGARWGL